MKLISLNGLSNAPLRHFHVCVTDTFHKPGFKLHARILHHLFLIVIQGDVIRAPLWDVQAKGPNAYPNNALYAREAVTELLCKSFPNMQKQQVEVRRMHSIFFLFVHVFFWPALSRLLLVSTVCLSLESFVQLLIFSTLCSAFSPFS